MSRGPSPAAVQVVTAQNALSRFCQHTEDGVVNNLEQTETRECLIDIAIMSWHVLVNQQYASQCLNTGCENTPNYHMSQLQDKAQAEIDKLEAMKQEPVYAERKIA